MRSSAAVFDLVPTLPAARRAPSAIGRLMQLWEQEHAADDPESEADLMVMLSGMVAPDTMRIDEH
jgi:hypothetical protein